MAMAPCTTFLHVRSSPVSTQPMRSSWEISRKFNNIQAKVKIFPLCKRRRHTELRLHSISLLPLFTIAATRPIEEYFNTWSLGEQEIKNIYMVFVILFSFGCCVAGSMVDPYYDGDEYRRAGGDGSVHWQYDKVEREEIEARQELWEEEFQRELEEKAQAMKQLEDGKEEETEEEKELLV